MSVARSPSIVVGVVKWFGTANNARLTRCQSPWCSHSPGSTGRGLSGVRESLDGGMMEPRHDPGASAGAVRTPGTHKGGAQAAERLPYDVAGTGADLNGRVNRFQGLLASMKAPELPPHVLTVSVDSLGPANVRSPPEVGDPDRTPELGSLPRPPKRRERAHPIDAEIRTALWVAMSVGVEGQGFRSPGRRETP